MEAQKQFSDAVAGFALKLYSEIVRSHPGQNVFISPFSVVIALAMACEGAQGETRRAVQNVLGIQLLDPEVLHDAVRVVLNQLQYSAETNAGSEDELLEPPRLITANGIWMNKEFTILPGFMHVVTGPYQAQLSQLDFSDPVAPDTINQWISQQTHGKIDNIIETLDPLAVLILVNTVYFKAAWYQDFLDIFTRTRSFQLLDGSTKSHPMMTNSAKFQYLETAEFQAIKLYYWDNGQSDICMYVFLPTPDSSLTSLQNILLNSGRSYWTSGYLTKYGLLRLPRFKIEFDAHLKAVLTALGLGVIFNPAQAEFTEIIESPQQPIWIHEILHKTYISVDEKGTEAAAATALLLYGSRTPPELEFEMIVDRPFFYMIMDEKSGLILFMGCVTEPFE